MRIGVDLDNTLACYDGLFHRLARERGLLPEGIPPVKDRVRDHLRAAGREGEWTAMQGEVYGARMSEAPAYPGAPDCLRRCRERGDEVRIISHRTRHPYAGARHDLHASAREWIRDVLGFPEEGVFLEPTAEAKLERIRSEKCEWFIDDLPEFLSRDVFPKGVSRVLFDPNGAHAAPEDVLRAGSWREVESILGLTDPVQESGLEEAAGALALGAGLRRPFRLWAIPGGRNNRVYRLEADGAVALVKSYFRHPGDPRDRLGTEHAFLSFLWARGIRCVPRPLGADPVRGLGLYAYVDGERVRPGEVTEADVRQALDFFIAINRVRDGDDARVLPEASESCRTLDDHLCAVSGRLARLGALEPATDVAHEAASFVHGDLAAAWERVRLRALALARGAGLDPAAPIAGKDRRLSPSDFGFHNALRARDGRIRFLDFEYAGWDDPAKAVCDLFSQPEVPAPLAPLGGFLDALAEEGADGALALRVRALLPVHLLKWCCLALGEFLPVSSERRRFAGGGADSAREGERALLRARAALGRLDGILACADRLVRGEG